MKMDHSRTQDAWAQSPLIRLASKILGYTIVLLTCVFLVLFLIWPVVVIVSKAFISDGHFTLEFFKLLFLNETQTSALWNSIRIGLAATFFSTLLSLPLAIIYARFEFKWKGLLSGLLLVPMIMPPFVGAIGIQRFFARFGAINIFLMERGWIDTPIEWLADENMFWVVVLLEVLHLYPIMHLNLSAAFSNIDPSLEEVAHTFGISRWRRYKDIVWPLAKPGFFAGASVVFIWALTDLGTPLLVGYHDTVPVKIFNLITDIHENPVGYALVCVVVMITIAFFLLSKNLLGGGKKYQMMSVGHVTPAMKKPSLLGSIFIYGLILSVVFVALIPHLTVFVTSIGENWFMTALPEKYTLKYYSMIFEHELSGIAIKNSFLFASLSTVLDLFLGLLIAFIVTRKLIPFAGVLDALVMIPLALPGIVIAFGYVVTYSHTFLDPLVNPVPLLVIAYAIRRLPYMVRSATAGLQQTSVVLEEASECFGATKLYTLRKITIPLVMANLIAGGVLCFSYAMLDVSDSLILAMKDRFYPITKAIYVLYQEQGSGEFLASALGVVSMVILAISIFISSSLLGKKMGELFRSG
ncbi:MAG: iron ABC transporter permease [Oligoflexales bacterium]|nr:iron ABC transporter permease [Oligoflexales bacterium]